MEDPRKGYERIMAAARAQKMMWAKAKLLAAELGYPGPVELIEAALDHYATYMREKRGG